MSEMNGVTYEGAEDRQRHHGHGHELLDFAVAPHHGAQGGPDPQRQVRLGIWPQNKKHDGEPPSQARKAWAGSGKRLYHRQGYP
ncbi:hypothetical protein [Nocardia sp. SYP-A9097]|uniref:hypothetical protein n=1 Tax=Nocardia sp. SYP-A9097 TaxID=2663237 RepID=UPI00129B6976|nr:hypothetical protein [Nocardia sp. SYP-A9097]